MLQFVKRTYRKIYKTLSRDKKIIGNTSNLLNPLFDVDINYTDTVEFSIKSIELGHHKLLYKGVPMIKCPFDYVIYQMILWEVKPDLIIEIGTNKGGSALYFADLLDMIGHGEIHTIDIVDLAYEKMKSHKRIKFFSGGFQSYNLKNCDGFKNILIIDDGSHTYEDVIATLNKFNSVVTIQSYFVVEDGILDKLGWRHKYNGGPNKAIEEFISKNKSFIIDRKWCDLFGVNATFNTNGFLKKDKIKNLIKQIFSLISNWINTD